MWKFFKWLFLIAVLAGAGWVGYRWYSAQSARVESFSLIPPDAIYCIATEDPLETWKQIARSATWAHLQKNGYFASLTASANSLDSLVRDNDMLFSMIGSRSLIVSAHMTGFKQYDFLFLVDLKEAAGIKFLNDYLTDFATEGYQVKKERYGSDDLITLHKPADNSNIFLAIPGSNLLISFTRKIVTSALDMQKHDPLSDEARTGLFSKVETDLDNTGILQLYLNYKRLPAFAACYSDGNNEYVNRLSGSLLTTALNVRMIGDIIRASGETLVDDSTESYVKTLAISGNGPTDILQITPQRTGFYLGFGFSSFPEFFGNFEKNIQSDVAEYAEYKANLKMAEDYLKISVQKNFIDWIGDEVAIIELQSSGGGLDNETALVLKADNIEKARQDLAYIEKMVRRRTPVKFKAIDHRGFTINYLSMKGVFKVLFGKFFARYDKPYFTIINNFVVFSNHPQTLESMIDDYLDKRTLNKSTSFKEFRKDFDDEGSVFVYINTPVLFNSMKNLADIATRRSMETNKEFITCFQQVGFQLVPGKSKFKTVFEEQFVTPPDAPVVEPVPDDEEVQTADSTAVSEPVETITPADEMALPYIYVRNLNVSSYTDYFEDSTIHYTVDLKGGFKEGSFTEYYPNGEKKMTGRFKKDKRDGTWRLYDEKGKLVLKRKYDDGEVDER